MKKVFLLLFIAVFCFSCSSSNDDSSSPNSSVYNPPTWIQGTWGIKANGTTIINDLSYYKFTSDNVCQLSSGISTLCWKEQIEAYPSFMSGSDTTTDTTYEVKLVQQNGVQTITLKFQKVSATKIKWLNAGVAGNTELDKLN